MPKSIKTIIYYLLLTLLVGLRAPIQAIYDPLSVPNNRLGVHILEPSEIFRASQLVNSTGGDWGYVTIPVRSDDRDYFKWLAFFKACKQFHLIPIIRLATYPVEQNWVEPTIFDIIDFANFLNIFPWPTQNRYIVLFNEPNHSKEWGGEISPENYVTISKFAASTFKQASPDFFLINAGLDMSAPNNRTSMDALVFYRRMFTFDPAWPDYFDGFSFHPYPNPAFSASAYSQNRYGIRSYEYELNYLKRFKVYPEYLFFTETGTRLKNNFYTPAFTSVWRDNRIVAITPFILYAGSGDFASFSLLSADQSQTANYREIFNLPKNIGKPNLSENAEILNNLPDTSSADSPEQIPVRPWWRSLIDFIVK